MEETAHHERARPWPQALAVLGIFIFIAAVVFAISWWDATHIPQPQPEPAGLGPAAPNIQVKPVEVDGMKCYVLYGDIQDFWCSGSRN